MKLTRTDFLKASLAVGFGLGGVACGDDNGDGGSDGTGGSAGADGTTTGGAAGTGGDMSAGGSGTGTCLDVTLEVEGGHSHPVDVPVADVEAGVEKTYTLEMGGTMHTHQLTVTAADFAELASMGMVSVVSTEDASHSHPVVLRCV